MATYGGSVFCTVLIFMLFLSAFCQPLPLIEVDKCAGKIKNCFCSNYSIDCDGAEFENIEELYPYISTSVSVVSVRGGRIINVNRGLFGKQMDHVVHLNLSGNGIVNLDEWAFLYTPNLKVLDLSGNQLTRGSEHSDTMLPKAVDGLPKLKELYLRQAFSTATNHANGEIGLSHSCKNSNVSVSLTSLELLDISGNQFTCVSPAFEKFLCDVSVPLRHLNMSNNLYTRFFVPICLTNLVHLDYSKNRLTDLTVVESDVIESLVNLKDMRLGGNPFACDCGFENTFSWLQSTDQPLDFQSIVCSSSVGNVDVAGNPIRGMNFTDICGEPRISICYGPWKASISKKGIFLASAAGLVAVVAILIIVLVCRKRRARRREGGHRMINQTEAEVKVPPYSRMV